MKTMFIALWAWLCGAERALGLWFTDRTTHRHVGRHHTHTLPFPRRRTAAAVLARLKAEREAAALAELTKHERDVLYWAELEEHLAAEWERLKTCRTEKLIAIRLGIGAAPRPVRSPLRTLDDEQPSWMPALVQTRGA